MPKRKHVTAPAIVSRVKQILETDCMNTANILLDSGEWILLNSYKNHRLSNIPVCRLGRICEKTGKK